MTKIVGQLGTLAELARKLRRHDTQIAALGRKQTQYITNPATGDAIAIWGDISAAPSGQYSASPAMQATGLSGRGFAVYVGPDGTAEPTYVSGGYWVQLPGSGAGTFLPVADPSGTYHVDSTSYPNSVTSTGNYDTAVFPEATGALAIALEGDAYPRWVLVSDPEYGLWMGDGTIDPLASGAYLAVSAALIGTPITLGAGDSSSVTAGQGVTLVGSGGTAMYVGAPGGAPVDIAFPGGSFQLWWNAGNPNGVVSAGEEGDLCIDGSTPALWQATASGDSSWVNVGGTGSLPYYTGTVGVGIVDTSTDGLSLTENGNSYISLFGQGGIVLTDESAGTFDAPVVGINIQELGAYSAVDISSAWNINIIALTGVLGVQGYEVIIGATEPVITAIGGNQLGFFSAVPVAEQPTPSTLAEVIVLLQAYGLST